MDKETFDNENMVTYRINSKKVNQFGKIYELMKKLVKGEDAKIKRELHKPFPIAGTISITGEEIEIIQPQIFIMMMKKYATGIEIDTDMSGNIKIEATFYGIAERVDD